ncbi:MAG: magnesium transporter, partial [Hymenobacter sp.]
SGAAVVVGVSTVGYLGFLIVPPVVGFVAEAANLRWSFGLLALLGGIMLGLILGLVGFGRIAIWQSISPIYGPHWLLVATTVGVALVGIVLWGSIAGSMLPLILRRLGLDPATSSAPFVATLVDVTGLIIYFTVALVMLRGTLL